MTTMAFLMPRLLLLLQLVGLILLSFPMDHVNGTGRQARVWMKKSQIPDSSMYGKCPSGWKENQRRWKKNVKKWSNPNCYSYVLTRSCRCRPDARGPNRIQVQDGKITSVTYLGQKETPSQYPISNFDTMNDLFKDVYMKCFAGCPSTGATKCTIQYDPTLGYVTNTYIDITKKIADEEKIYSISEFQEC